MLKKLKSRAGLTLTELLVTLLIMSLFSTACLIGITTAFRARQDNIKANDADILASMVTQLITDELRLSEFESAPASGSEITFMSTAYNSVTLKFGDYKVTKDGEEKTYPGRLLMTINSASPIDQMMLNNAAYTNTLLLANPHFEVVEEGGSKSIKVTFEVCDEDESKVLASREFYVKPLNDIPS